MLLLFKLFQVILFYISIALLIIALTISICLFKKHYFDKILTKLIRFIVPKSYQDKVQINFSDFKQSLKTLSWGSFVNNFLLSFAGWFIYFFQIYIVAKALSIPINFLYISIFVTISSFFALLPITISGIGSRDLVLITLFSELGIVKEKAIALSLLILLILIIGGAWGWLAGFFRPLKTGHFKKTKYNKLYEKRKK